MQAGGAARVALGIERLAREDLDIDEVEVDRVGVARQVEDLPDLGVPAWMISVGLSTYSRPNSGTEFTAVSVPRNWISRPYASNVSLSVRRRTGTPAGSGVGTPGVWMMRNGSVGVRARAG